MSNVPYIRSLSIQILAAGVFVAHLSLLGGAAYTHLATRYVSQSLSASEQVIRAAKKQLPWQTGEFSRLAAEWELSHDAKLAAQSFRSALEQRPIDPLLWSRYSLAELYTGNYLASERAGSFALRLAANTYAVTLEQSAIGAIDFIQVEPATFTLRRAAALIAYSINEKATLSYLIRNRREHQYCNLIKSGDAAYDWCRSTSTVRQLCDNSEASNAKLREQCVRMLYLQP